MDPGGIGALIGISIMLGACACMKLYDIFEKKKKNSVTTPLLPVQHTEAILINKKHWKVNELFTKKKTILLKNLNSMSASRNLTTSNTQ